MLLGGILLGLGTWGFFEFRANQRWKNYVEKLQSEPGIVITDAQKRHGKYFISGLRDPLAADPIKMVQKTKLNSASVISQWKPYLSLETEMIALRAKKVLQPPKTVILSVDESGILYASGTAPRLWILETRRLAPTIPGVTQYQEKNLVETEKEQLISTQKKIESQVILFAKGSEQLVQNQAQKIQDLAREIQGVAGYAQVLGKNVRIEIIGRTDQSGIEETNMILSKARADAIKSILISQGVETTNLSLVGVGIKNPLRKELSEKDKAPNRSVSFKVIVTDASN
jgi:outer membrane protein OmpA-like peptidoglycan-associated protein